MPTFADDALYKIRAKIDALRTDATVLLMRAQNDAMRAHVRSAQRELTDALSLLDYEQQTQSQALLIQVLGEAIHAATHRLEMVERALQIHGPDTSDID